jgi:hypothetical protein
MFFFCQEEDEEEADADVEEDEDEEDDEDEDEEDEKDKDSGIEALVTGSEEKFSDVIEMAAKFQPTGNTLVRKFSILRKVKSCNCS